MYDSPNLFPYSSIVEKVTKYIKFVHLSRRSRLWLSSAEFRRQSNTMDLTSYLPRNIHNLHRLTVVPRLAVMHHLVLVLQHLVINQLAHIAPRSESGLHT